MAVRCVICGTSLPDFAQFCDNCVAEKRRREQDHDAGDIRRVEGVPIV